MTDVPWSIHRSQGAIPLKVTVTLLVPGPRSARDAVDSLFKLGAVRSVANAEWGDVYPITDVEEQSSLPTKCITPSCVRPVGHDGFHRAEDGSEWTQFP